MYLERRGLPNAPVMEIKRTVLADTKRPVEWARIVANAALYTFNYEYDIPEGSQEQKQEATV